MRDVGEEGTERDQELDVERARELDDLVREGSPADVRLDADENDDVALEVGKLRVEEDGLRPVDAPRDAVDERDVRPRRLEIEELLGIDVREPTRAPGLREEARRKRRALRSVVPAPEGGDEDGTAKRRPPFDAEVVGDSRSEFTEAAFRGPAAGAPSSRAARSAARRAVNRGAPTRLPADSLERIFARVARGVCRACAGSEEKDGGDRDDPGPDRGRERDVDQHEPPRKLVPPLELADRHLDEEEP